MKTLIIPRPRRKRRCYDFAFPNLNTFIRLEACRECVVIRATRDTFSEARKRSFIRELAAEGFIDDWYRWFSVSETPLSGLRWVIDDSWLVPDRAAGVQTNRFMLRLLVGAGVLWFALLAIVFVLAH